MTEQHLILLAEWKQNRFSFSVSNSCLAKYGQLGYINPPPEKMGGKWVIDKSAVYLGKGARGVEPFIRDDDDDLLKEILQNVTEATKK